MKLQLTQKESENFFYNALCNALGNNYGQYYADPEMDVYNKAKKTLQEKKTTLDAICSEDVYMQILRNGDFLQFRDKEKDAEYDRKIYLADVHQKVSLPRSIIFLIWLTKLMTLIPLMQ